MTVFITSRKKMVKILGTSLGSRWKIHVSGNTYVKTCQLEILFECIPRSLSFSAIFKKNLLFIKDTRMTKLKIPEP